MSGPQSAVLGGQPQPPMQCCSSWHCQGELAAVLRVSGEDLPAQNEEEPSREQCVRLELPSSSQGDSPCTLSLLCAAQGKDRILNVTICCEARTIELYGGSQDDEDEEYLGTSRGERLCTLESSGEDSPVILYKTHLKFEFPVPSCTLKLLSLGGQVSVLVSEISLKMTSVPERCSPASYVAGPSINLDRVQSIMSSMGGKMSPGAEQFMSMVRAQQKAPFGAHFMQLFCSFHQAGDQNKEEARIYYPLVDSKSPDTKMEKQGQASALLPSVQRPSPESGVKSLMSSLLQKSLGPASTSSGPDSLKPLLPNICGESRQESCSASKEEEKTYPEWQRVLSAHMERTERTLMEHIDQKMRSLQEHLDTRVDGLIHLVQGNNSQSDHGDQQDDDCGDLPMH